MVAVLSRTKRIPTLKSLLSDDTEPLTPEELADARELKSDLAALVEELDGS